MQSSIRCQKGREHPPEGMLDVLSFGDFSLHEQRKVTRSAAGRVEAL
jgi:hypothetical protein